MQLRAAKDYEREAEPAQGGQYGPDFRSYTKQVICH